jgi:hypothetical protein
MTGVEREHWPVLIYRLQSHRGWEVCADAAVMPPPSSSTTNSKNKLASKISNSSTAATSSGVEEELTAAPREGCIEVRKLRLRIRLFQQHLPWDAVRQHQSPAPPAASGRSNNGCDERNTNYNNGSNNDSRQTTTQLQQYRGNNDTPGLDGWNDNALVVRRRNTLLITTRRGRGAIMFRFLSTRDCIDFCDQLVYLNRHLLFRNDDDDEVVHGAAEDVMAVKDNAAVSGGGGRKMKCVNEPNELRIDEVNSAKRRRLAVLGDRNRREDVGGSVVMQTPRQEAIVNYLVQLAHSQDFRGFVDEIERGLEYGDDTAAIHAALGV